MTDSTEQGKVETSDTVYDLLKTISVTLDLIFQELQKQESLKYIGWPKP